jgi:hypothetical protein
MRVNIDISCKEPYEDVEEYDSIHKELKTLAKTQNEQCLRTTRNANCNVYWGSSEYWKNVKNVPSEAIYLFSDECQLLIDLIRRLTIDKKSANNLG